MCTICGRNFSHNIWLHYLFARWFILIVFLLITLSCRYLGRKRTGKVFSDWANFPSHGSWAHNHVCWGTRIRKSWLDELHDLITFILKPISIGNIIIASVLWGYFEVCRSLYHFPLSVNIFIGQLYGQNSFLSFFFPNYWKQFLWSSKF